MKFSSLGFVVSLLALSSTVKSAFPQAVEFTQNKQEVKGEQNKLTVTLTSTQGVSASSVTTPGYAVSTKANMVIGPDSYTNTSVSDTVAASLSQGNGLATGSRDLSLSSSGNVVTTPTGPEGVGASGFAQGLKGSSMINLNGSQYEVRINPVDGYKHTETSISTGQASGSSGLTLGIESTSSSFINTFMQQF